MSVGRIIRHFEALGKVPVDIEQVVAQVRGIVPDEQISVKAVDDEYVELRAAIARTKIEDGTTFMVPIYKSVVVYSARMPPGWQRLACCKELLHIVEPAPLWTSSIQEVVGLAEKMAHRKIHNPASPNGLQALADTLGKWQAVAVLFPYSLYEGLFPLFQAQRVTCQQIADHVELPEEIVGVVMSPLWAVMRETILAWS